MSVYVAYTCVWCIHSVCVVYTCGVWCINVSVCKQTPRQEEGKEPVAAFAKAPRVTSVDQAAEHETWPPAN